MPSFKFTFLTSLCLPVSIILFLFCVPVYGAEAIDGFRELKFGMTPQEIHALPNCSTPYECMYELSNKNRYINLVYDSKDKDESAPSLENGGLQKISIDMGRYTEDWYQQLQVMLGASYRLTHDYAIETMEAFLSKDLDKLQAGYEDGQVLLMVVRRQFGNMTLKVIYQNPMLAEEYVRKTPTTQAITP